MADITPGNPEQQQLQQAYPPPPAYYKSHGPDAEPGNPLLLPPPPIVGEYQFMGELYTTYDGIPPLTVQQLFTIGPGGRLDFRAELGRLNRELLFAYLDLVNCLVDHPSAYARAVENVGVLARNLTYLLNALRSHQARAMLEHFTRVEIADRRQAIQEFREGIKRAEGIMQRAAKDLQGTLSSYRRGPGRADDSTDSMQT